MARHVRTTKSLPPGRSRRTSSTVFSRRATLAREKRTLGFDSEQFEKFNRKIIDWLQEHRASITRNEHSDHQVTRPLATDLYRQWLDETGAAPSDPLPIKDAFDHMIHLEIRKINIRKKRKSTIDAIAAGTPDASGATAPSSFPDEADSEMHEALAETQEPTLEPQEPAPDVQDPVREMHEPGDEPLELSQPTQPSAYPRQGIKDARALLQFKRDQAKAYDERIAQWFRANPSTAPFTLTTPAARSALEPLVDELYQAWTEATEQSPADPAPYRAAFVFMISRVMSGLRRQSRATNAEAGPSSNGAPTTPSMSAASPSIPREPLPGTQALAHREAQGSGGGGAASSTGALQTGPDIDGFRIICHRVLPKPGPFLAMMAEFRDFKSGRTGQLSEMSFGLFHRALEQKLGYAGNEGIRWRDPKHGTMVEICRARDLAEAIHTAHGAGQAEVVFEIYPLRQVGLGRRAAV